MKLFIVLHGASKHHAALIMPCGSAQFFYDNETNKHLLDGGPLTVERFNEAVTDFANHWPDGQYRPLPWIVAEEKRNKLVKPATLAQGPALALA